jgi:hypothetical protein
VVPMGFRKRATRVVAHVELDRTSLFVRNLCVSKPTLFTEKKRVSPSSSGIGDCSFLADFCFVGFLQRSSG